MKYLSIKKLSDSDGQVTFCIDYQYGIRTNFYRNHSQFISSKGFRLASCDQPGVGFECLYCRGSFNNRDNDILTCNRETFEKIINAVDEMNGTNKVYIINEDGSYDYKTTT